MEELSKLEGGGPVTGETELTIPPMQIAVSPPVNLIELALQKQADPNIIEKLMALSERWEANQAKKAFVRAMTAFKQEAPAVLIKGDRVDFTSSRGRTAYNYANLGSIVQEITSILGKHELSASWATSQTGTDVTVTCNITHVGGHRESVTLTGPIDESGNKNRIQAVGSTVTYLQRYTLLSALGLATGEDDDGRGGVPKNQPPIQEPPKHKASEKPNGTCFINTPILGHRESKNAKGQPVYWITGELDGNEQSFSTFDSKIFKIAVDEAGTGNILKLEYVKKEAAGKVYLNIISLTRPEPLQDENAQ